MVETSLATLDEAIDQGEFALSREFSPADLRGVTMAEGVTMVQAAVMGPNNTFFFELNDVVLWDDDRNLSTTDDQVRANGSIELSPDVDFRWLKESGRAANFEFTVELEQEVELELESRISRELEPLRYQIARLNLGDYVAFVGVVPVYIQVVMPIYLRADGEVSAGMVMAVTQTLTVEAGVRRYNDEWQPIGDLDNRFTFEPPRLSLGGKVKGYIDPPLSLLLYGVGGPFVGANPFLELDADLFKTPWWELHAGIDVTVGVRGEILGRSLGEYTHAVIGYRVLLAQATTRPPTTPHSPSPADAATATSLAPTLSWQGGDPDGDAVTYTVRLGTANPPPPVAADQTQTTYSPATLVANTTYYWQIVAQDARGATTAGPVWRFTTAAPTPTATPTATSIPPTATPSPGFNPAEEILIPAGSFQMGCDSSNPAESCTSHISHEQPLHTVTLSAYSIDKYEVTNARYKACVDAGGCTAPQSVDSSTRSPYYGTSTYADYPVIYVTWYQADAFCAWAGKRLPTEAEWEKAARGSSDTRKYPWGDSAPDCTKLNYYRYNGVSYEYCVGDTSRVGSYPSGASPYGVMDMAGNVFEWVNDWFDYSYYSVSPSSNPQGPESGGGRVLRGGSWINDGSDVRSALRSSSNPDYWGYDLGFRCVRSQ